MAKAGDPNSPGGSFTGPFTKPMFPTGEAIRLESPLTGKVPEGTVAPMFFQKQNPNAMRVPYEMPWLTPSDPFQGPFNRPTLPPVPSPSGGGGGGAASVRSGGGGLGPTFDFSIKGAPLSGFGGLESLLDPRPALPSYRDPQPVAPSYRDLQPIAPSYRDPRPVPPSDRDPQLGGGQFLAPLLQMLMGGRQTGVEGLILARLLGF